MLNNLLSYEGMNKIKSMYMFADTLENIKGGNRN